MHTWNGTQRRSLAAALALLLALVWMPEAAAQGARRGLSLCAEVILPSLLPFLVLSGLLNALGLPALLGHALGPAMRRLLRAPGAAATPLLLGLTGGYPMGAAALAELVRSGQLSPEDGNRLLPVCNNTGPAFALGALGLGVFHSAGAGALLYAAHILAALLLGLLTSRGKSRAASPAADSLVPSFAVSLPAALPGAVRGAVAAALNICGFLILFSVLGALLDRSGLLPWAVLNLCRSFGLEPGFVRALLLGILELGSGVGALRGLPLTPLNLALAAFLLGFGSLSVHCQTLSVLEGTNVEASRLLTGRLLHAAISAALVFTCFSLLQ